MHQREWIESIIHRDGWDILQPDMVELFVMDTPMFLDGVEAMGCVLMGGEL